MKTSDNINLGLLLEGCRQGKRVSQLKVYEHFYSYGMGLGLRYAKNREEAMEVVNDSFLKAFNKIDQYDPDLPFKPWLRRILIRTAIDYYRKYHKGDDTPDDLIRILEKNTKTANEAIRKLDYEDTIQAIQGLSPAYRMVFNLFVMEDYSHQEIAEALDISVGTSKSNLSKAKRQMRNLLKGEDGLYSKSQENE